MSTMLSEGQFQIFFNSFEIFLFVFLKWHDEHKQLTCDQYADWLRDNDPDDADVQLLKYLNTAGMVCPNETCRAVYE
jgi:hypothetical protein